MELIALFYQHQIKLGYNLKSCKNQYSILLEFFHWLEYRDKTLTGINQEDIQNYYHYLQNRPHRRNRSLLSPKTIYSHIKTLEIFYIYIGDQK